MMSPPRALLPLLVSAAFIGAPRSVQAQSAIGCIRCALWVPVGINLGGISRWSNGDNRGAFLLGGEISYLDMRNESANSYWGGYLDVTYDTHDGLARSSIGPELMLVSPVPMGVDLGPLIEWNWGQAYIGARARFFVPLLFVTPYVGGFAVGLGEPSVGVEAGVLLKLPILWKQNH